MNTTSFLMQPMNRIPDLGKIVKEIKYFSEFKAQTKWVIFSYIMNKRQKYRGLSNKKHRILQVNNYQKGKTPE